MLKGDISGKLACMFDHCREDLNKLLEDKKEQNVSWVQGDNGKRYFTVPTLVKQLREHFGFELTLRSKKIDDMGDYVHVEYGLYFGDTELSCGTSQKPRNLTAGDLVGTNAIECAETAAIGRTLKFFFGVNSDVANDEEIKYSKGINNRLTVIETLEKRRENVNVPSKN